MKRNEESKLQQQCVAWFRAEYPQYAMLLTHPINEGGRNTRVSGAIHKAEGTVAGVADLLFFLPSYEYKGAAGKWCEVHGLGIEMKTPKGSQQQEQKDFQKMFEAAGYSYHVVRTFDDFRLLMMQYIGLAYDGYKKDVKAAHKAVKEAAEQREKEKFLKVIGKK